MSLHSQLCEWECPTCVYVCLCIQVCGCRRVLLTGMSVWGPSLWQHLVNIRGTAALRVLPTKRQSWKGSKAIYGPLLWPHGGPDLFQPWVRNEASVCRKGSSNLTLDKEETVVSLEACVLFWSPLGCSAYRVTDAHWHKDTRRHIHTLNRPQMQTRNPLRFPLSSRKNRYLHAKARLIRNICFQICF